MRDFSRNIGNFIEGTVGIALLLLALSAFLLTVSLMVSMYKTNYKCQQSETHLHSL